MKLNQQQALAFWKAGMLFWKLHGVQLKIYKQIKSLPAHVREALVFCSRRLGKSYLATAMAIEDCLQGPNRQVFIVAPSLKQARAIVVPLVRMIAKDAPEGLIKLTKSTLRYEFSNGSTLILGGFDTALESFRGMYADNIYVEESGLANSDEYQYTLKSVLLPMLMHSRGRIIHFTTPAKLPDHPLHTETLPEAQLAGAFFKYSIRDNPLLSLEDIEAEIESMGGINSAHTKRELFCEIFRDSNQVAVPEFDEAKHVQDFPIPVHMNCWIGGDLGGVRDKTVLLKLGYDFYNAKVLVLDERVFDSKTTSDFVVEGGKQLEDGKSLPRYVDSHGDSRVDYSGLHNWPIIFPTKPEFDVQINRLQLLFHHNQILVHPRCTFLIQTLRSGMLDKNRKGFRYTEVLGHCDALAALSYGTIHINKANPYPLPTNHFIPADLEREGLAKNIKRMFK